MRIPFDIPFDKVTEVITSAIDNERARKTPVSVYVLIDETARPEFQVFVRSGFSSDSVNSRLMVGYYPTQPFDPAIDVDLVVLAAGENPQMASVADQVRQAGTACLVVSEDAASLMEAAQAQGCPLPEEDVVCPEAGEPFAVEGKGSLSDAIGSWIVRKVPSEKKLAFSIAYPFVRRPLAYDAVNATAAQNAGVGVVVFVPGADMPIMTANQVKMVLQVAAAYGEPLSSERLKEMVGVLANALFFRSVSRQLAGAVPALGWAVKGAMGYAGTQAIGHAAIQYFEAGGNVAGVAAVVGKARDAAMDAAAKAQGQPVYQVVAGAAGPVVRKVADVFADAAAPVAKSAAKAAFSAVKPGAKKKRAKAKASA